VIGTVQKVLLNSVTQWNTAFLEKLTVPQLVQKFPALYGIQRVAVLNSPPLVFVLKQINPLYVHPSHFFKNHINNTSHLYLGLQSCLFPSVFPTKTLDPFFFAPLCIFPAYIILLDCLHNIWRGVQFKELIVYTKSSSLLITNKSVCYPAS